jgi:putative transposase
VLVNQAFRFELDPTKAQRVLLAKHAGCARFAYGWALARKKALIEAKKTGVAPETAAPGIRTDADRPPPKPEAKPHDHYFESAIDQHWTLNRLKDTMFPWLREVSKCVPQEAIRNLERAFSNWRAGRAEFPRFKKKFVHDSFRLTVLSKKAVDGRSVTLPRLGKIRIKEPASKFKGRILSATVSREADRWYVSFAVEVERLDPTPVQGPVVGVDLGLTNFAASSTPDGLEVEFIHSPKPFSKIQKKLAKRQRQHARKEKGSKNRRKVAVKLSRLHRKAKNTRKDFTHKFTTRLAKTKSVIVLEDLNVSGMLSNRRLARSISDAGWGEVRRQLEYKTRWHGSKLVVFPRFEPSTGPCSGCGARNAWVKLGIQEFVCEGCGKLIQRDSNAAKNLALYGERTTGSSPGSVSPSGGDACGETTAGPVGRSAGRRPRRSRKKADNPSRRKVG